MPATEQPANIGPPLGDAQPNPRYSLAVKVADVLRLLQQQGWALVAQRGSHRQFKHPSKPGRVTIAGKPSDDLAPGTLSSILKQAGMK
jgi:predicted RNA binding protein YcfA (HicA-like mRNA interferase family)